MQGHARCQVEIWGVAPTIPGNLVSQFDGALKQEKQEKKFRAHAPFRYNRTSQPRVRGSIFSNMTREVVGSRFSPRGASSTGSLARNPCKSSVAAVRNLICKENP